MRLRVTVGALALAALALSSGIGAEGVKSGPQVGKTIPGAFHPLNCTGANAGEKFCLVWKNGNNPVAMIFAREISDPLTSLVKKIDVATAANKKCRMGSFVVFLSDNEGLDKQLKSLADKEGIKNTVLTIDNPAGPNGYNVAKDADVTVVLYDQRKVESNHAFRKGELTPQAIDRVVGDLKKILPEGSK